MNRKSLTTKIYMEGPAAERPAPAPYLAPAFYFVACIILQLLADAHPGPDLGVNWFPFTGIAIVAVYASGLRVVPVLAAAGILTTTIGQTSLPALERSLAEMGATLALCVIGSVLLRRLEKTSSVAISVRDLGTMLGVIGFTSVATGTCTCVIQFWGNQLRGEDVRALLGQLALAHALGAITVVPFLLVHVVPRLNGAEKPAGSDSLEWELTARSTRPSRLSVIERSLQLAAGFFTPWVLISYGFDQRDVCDVIFIVLLWIAVRQGVRGVVIGVLLANISTFWALRHVPVPAITEFQFQAALLIAALVGLSVGSLVSEIAIARSKLQHQTVFLDALQNHSPIAAILHDASGRIIASNIAFRDLFGFSAREMKGRNVDEFLISPVPNEATTLTQRLISGESVHTHAVRLRKDGRKMSVELWGIPFLLKGQLIGGIRFYRDITRQNQLEEELMLAQKLQAVGQLAGGVAHDFNNMLGVIQGYTEFLLERIPQADPLRQSVEEIGKAGDRATNLTRQLLAFGRKQVIQPRPLDLGALVTESSGMLSRLIGEHIKLEVHVIGTAGSIVADQGQVEQIIINLAVNARDAMPQGGRLTISISSQNIQEDDGLRKPIPAGRYVALTMSDTGVGISPEHLPQIFDPFFTTKEKGKGTGLGLSTVYGIAEQSGAHIRIESALGAGTTFTILFPASSAVQPVVSHVPVVDGDRMLRGTETILVVEDEPVLRKMIVDLLESLGYEVLSAESASEATAHAQLFESTIHLLLTDIVMPEMNGVDLARFIYALRPDARVLYMSGYADGALGDSFVLPKDVDFIQKPFSRARLGHRVREILDLNLVSQINNSRTEVLRKS